MPGKIISVMNFKGGVGKTTLAVNLAACLAKEYNKKTLLMDLDPQSNASIWLLTEDKWKEKNKRANTLKTAASIFFNKFSLDNCLTPLDDALSGRNIKKLWLLPASFHMIELESQIFRAQIKLQVDGKYVNGNEYRYLARMRKLLAEHFDYVVIDCPPNLYTVTKNALFHSDYLIIPCIPNALSRMGLKLLLHYLENMIVPFAPKMETTPLVLSVVITRYNERLHEHEVGIKAMKSILRDFQEEVPEAITVNGRTAVLDYPIREYNSHSVAVQHHLPLCLHEEMGKAYGDVKANTQALVEAMEGVS
ncbi:MAG: ParA family protein [Desulfomonilaceae bacterium]